MAETMERVWVSERESAQFGQLVERHAGMVFSIAISILRNRADAEDAVQNCFVRVMRKKWRLAFVADERAWVARIAQRAALDLLKRRRGEEEIGERDFPAPDMHSGAELANELKALAAAVRSLPTEQREVVELAYFGGLSYRDVARALGIPEGTVRSEVFHARRRLRVLLADWKEQE